MPDAPASAVPWIAPATPKLRPEEIHTAARIRGPSAATPGSCVRCGNRPAPEGGTVCDACREARRVSDRERYGARRAAGLCVICGQPAFADETLCGVCAAIDHERRDRERKNSAARLRYAERRRRWRCTACGRPSHGASRCEPCARKSYERSEHVRGLPLYPPGYTIVNAATGEEYDTCGSWEEVALCLAFEGLSLDEVDVVVDQSPMAFMTASPWE